MKNDPNIQRLNRGNLPASMQVSMGTPLVQPAPSSVMAPLDLELQNRVNEQAAKVKSLQEDLSKVGEILQQIGPPNTPVPVLLQNLKAKALAFEDLNQQLLQKTSEAETLTKKANDLEEELAEATKMLDTGRPFDKVWVTSIQSRSVEEDAIVVTCTMHSGQESASVTGTILIPKSEFGKLKPPKQQ